MYGLGCSVVRSIRKRKRMLMRATAAKAKPIREIGLRTISRTFNMPAERRDSSLGESAAIPNLLICFLRPGFYPLLAAGGNGFFLRFLARVEGINFGFGLVRFVAIV